jgi:TP901 family phage tail tape measure protein
MGTSRRAEVGLYANPKKLKPGLREAQGILGGFGRGVKGVFSSVAGAVGGFISRAFDPMGRAYDLIQSQATEVFDFEKGVARLAIAQGKTNEQMGGFRTQVTAISEETGIARNEVLQGAAAYQALTGDTQGATDAARTFARVAVATGTNVGDVATAAASLQQNLHIDTADFEKAFSVLNTQGKAGAVELHDWAGLVASLSAKFQRFKGASGVHGVQELGAALQIAKRGFGSASEAATGVEGLMTAIVKNAKKLQKAHIRVFDVDPKTHVKTLRSFSEIIQSISNSKLAKDPALLAKALGRQEAEQTFQMLKGNWSDFQGLVNTTDFSSIGKDMDTYLNSPAGKLEKSWNAMKLAMAEAFTPERIQAFAAAIDKLLPAVEKLGEALGFIADKVGGVANDAEEAWAHVNQWATGKGEQSLGAQGGFKPGLSTTPAAPPPMYTKNGGINLEPRAPVGGASVFETGVVGQRFGAAPSNPTALPTTQKLTKDQADVLKAALAKYDSSKPSKVDVTVKAAPGLSVQIDNDPSHRTSPR